MTNQVERGPMAVIAKDTCARKSKKFQKHYLGWSKSIAKLCLPLLQCEAVRSLNAI
jgi:hypothetical protein